MKLRGGISLRGFLPPQWTEDEEAEVHGPFTAREMLNWQKEGFFKDGIFVREVTRGKHGVFYPLARMDFELYIDDE